MDRAWRCLHHPAQVLRSRDNDPHNPDSSLVFLASALSTFSSNLYYSMFLSSLQEICPGGKPEEESESVN